MRALVIVLSMVAMLVTANCARADQRVAFVVGNGTYKNLPRLPNAPISATAMAGLLKSIGFEVVEGNRSDARCNDRETARIRQEGRRRRYRGIFLCRSQYRGYRHQLSAADRR